MAKRIHQESPLIGVFSEEAPYLKARAEIEENSAEGLVIADIPLLIQALTTHPNIKNARRPYHIDTVSGEYLGIRGGVLCYEVWHSVGSLTTLEGLTEAFEKRQGLELMSIHPQEWEQVGQGKYLGMEIERFSLDDIKNGRAPTPGTPSVISTKFESLSFGQVWSPECLLKDDHILMIAGSLEQRKALIDFITGPKGDYGEGFRQFKSYADLGQKQGQTEIPIHSQPRGHLISLGIADSGLRYSGVNSDGTNTLGCFLRVRPE